jgi:preprotein translocase subunit SecD
MDRSLRWRTIALVAAMLFCVATLAPTFLDKDSLPSWFTHFFSKEINLGLDLQGGKHIVYNIALDKAIDDRASDIKRDLESDTKLNVTVKTPATPTGAFTVIPTDPKKKDEVANTVKADYKCDIDSRECNRNTPPQPGDDPPEAVCFVVAASYADNLRKDALANAVSTIRERINEKGVAEPSVVEKGEDIIVELPGDPNSDAIKDTEELIARTAKLEMKVVDDCGKPSKLGCTAKDMPHDGAPYMISLVKKINPDAKYESQDPEAKALGIRVIPEQWTPDEGGGRHNDWSITADDREEAVPIAWAKKHQKITDRTKIEGDKVRVTITGREIIERYIDGDKDLNYKGLACKWCDPKDRVQQYLVPDDHEIGYEPDIPDAGAKDQHVKWRTYYLERAVRLTGTSIQSAMGSYDPNTNRPVVELDFNRFGSRIFGDVTPAIAGMKFATLLDDKVKSAPIINGPITGGRAQITMGGGDPKKQEKERDDLVAVLKTGSLPAPLVEASESTVGPTLGRDAIQKTQTSFIIGIVLVVLIMVGVYKWSGMIAVFAVVFHIVMTLAVMALFGATLTLPGIAAIVLSIGMEVDGNILIYERIRDELLLGKSVRGAIDLGFSRAFSAILDGQLTTAAAGWVLLQYGSGPIKGFAVMLLVGVFTTLTTNIWVTRILFDHAVARKKGSHMHTLSI